MDKLKEIHKEEKNKILPEQKIKIMNNNQQMERIEESIAFYLDYHKVPEPGRTRILGNLLMIFKRELQDK